MEKFNFSYDSSSDDLFIYLEGKKSKGAVEIGNFVLDFDSNGDLVAIQILNAHSVLSKVLSNVVKMNMIREIRAQVINFRNMEVIQFQITTDKGKENANIFIPNIKEKSPVLQF